MHCWQRGAHSDIKNAEFQISEDMPTFQHCQSSSGLNHWWPVTATMPLMLSRMTLTFQLPLQVVCWAMLWSPLRPRGPSRWEWRWPQPGLFPQYRPFYPRSCLLWCPAGYRWSPHWLKPLLSSLDLPKKRHSCISRTFYTNVWECCGNCAFAPIIIISRCFLMYYIMY